LFENAIQPVFLKNLIFLTKNYFFIFSNRFDMLISKINFFKKIYILF
jgi:hypothetical protein